MRKLLITLSGQMSSGKDTFTNYLLRKMLFKQFAFADHLKVNLFNLVAPQNPTLTLNHFYDPKLKNAPIKIHAPKMGVSTTPRALMQWYGESVKEELGQMFWCKIVESQIKNSSYYQHNIIITDTRFDSEFNFIRTSPHILNNYRILSILITRHNLPYNDHISESIDIDRNKFDFILENDSSIENFYRKIDKLIPVFKDIEKNLMDEEFYINE